MSPIDFEGTNVTYGKPSDMTDEECTPLKAYKGPDEANRPCTLTAWMPNADDMKAINAGLPIYLKIVGEGMPPVALYTLNENNMPNWD